MTFGVNDVVVYDVPSESKAGWTYEVILGDGFGRCTCPDFFWRHTDKLNHGMAPTVHSCKHLDRLYPGWVAERDAAREQAGEAAAERTIVITAPAGTKVEVY